jgi:UDP-N-acetylmuramoylalanine--D-glutamate ligase
MMNDAPRLGASPPELAGKRVMVVGLGISGLAAARFIAGRGAQLVLTDIRSDLPSDGLPDGELHLGGDDPNWLNAIDLVIASPGVPRDSKLLSAATRTAIPVIGEIELASWFLRAPLIAITGTNGKSTVTTMVGEILRAAGLHTFVGGNLGTPLIEAVGRDYDAAVAEVSSYQLETIVNFRPHIAVYLNLSDDHLDRYRDREAYGAAKARMFINQTEQDWAILNRDDACVWQQSRIARSRIFGFSMRKPDDRAAADIWSNGTDLVFRRAESGGRIGMQKFKLPGSHNRANATAAAAAALAMGIEPDTISRALADFRGLPHRLEFVCEKDGVRFIDDSKGTNVGAVAEALRSLDGPVILLAGGVDKGGDYAPLRPLLEEKVRMLVLYGSAREKIRTALSGCCTIAAAETLAGAVRIAAYNARRGDVVLLSPACSSFDQFRNYAERGRLYQELVRAL